MTALRSSTAPGIAILTVGGDLHALAVRAELEEHHDVSCCIVECDRIPASGGLSWSTDSEFPPVLPGDRGETVPVDGLDVVWWRRANAAPFIPAEVTEPAHRELVGNDCRAAVLGMLLDRFRGTWVSDPLASRRAENKLVQLSTAAAAGLRTPRTLVSQDPEVIRRFCERLAGRIVVKPVRGTQVATPLTAMLDPRLLDEEEALALSPAIYQEYVPGRRHVRAHVFGDEVYSAELESAAVDWRADLNIPIRAVTLAPDMDLRLREVVRRLGLRMGVIDLKEADDGELVWLEINPQGQFLFVEGLCGLGLTSALAGMLAAGGGVAEQVGGPPPSASAQPGRRASEAGRSSAE